ncbi:hypothetical protein DFJ74DRAFT_703835 [Hyaloraphidium curvatum]|nr:hypothetical protein DFJ74DRAFT_703835 [Hyaloraphidium curvatum]
MPAFGHFAASVLVDGSPLREFVEEGGGDSTLFNGSPCRTAFIESQTGKRFKLLFRCSAPRGTYEGMVIIIRVDGRKLNNSKLKDIPGEMIKEGSMEGDGAMRARYPLIFNNVSLVSDMDGEEAERLLEEQLAKGVEGGKIMVEFWRAFPSAKQRPVRTRAPVAPHRTRIHEKAKKAFLTHTTGYGDPILAPTSRSSKTEWTKLDDAPLATFVFEYRSRLILETLGFDLGSPAEELPVPHVPSGPRVNAPPPGVAAPAVAAPAALVPKVKPDPAQKVKIERGLTIDLTLDD